MTDSTTSSAAQPVREWRGLTIPAAGSYTLDEAHKRLGFEAQHMMVSLVRGEFARAAASIVVGEDPLRSAVAASIDVTSLTTHNPDRDTHLLSPDFLDAERYPTIEFRSTGVSRPDGTDAIVQWARLRSRLPDRAQVDSDLVERTARTRARFHLAGDLTIMATTRPVELRLDFGGARRDPYGRDIFGFHATTEIAREDFGLVWNVALERGGWLVGSKVRIEISGEAIRDT